MRCHFIALDQLIFFSDHFQKTSPCQALDCIAPQGTDESSVEILMYQAQKRKRQFLAFLCHRLLSEIVTKQFFWSYRGGNSKFHTNKCSVFLFKSIHSIDERNTMMYDKTNHQKLLSIVKYLQVYYCKAIIMHLFSPFHWYYCVSCAAVQPSKADITLYILPICNSAVSTEKAKDYLLLSLVQVGSLVWFLVNDKKKCTRRGSTQLARIYLVNLNAQSSPLPLDFMFNHHQDSST